MKKLFLAALLTITVAASSFARDNKKISNLVIRSFRVEYAQASNVNWTSTNNYYKASFYVGDQKMEAFYNATGEKVATSRAITIDELPVKAKRAFARDFSDYTVKEAVEMDGTEDAGYFISAENEKETVILKVNSTGGLSTFKTTKK
ncbi:hypothetical protein [Segetibacter aerophilus]|uniref:Uncharacterized protein n=1 Tax=Segetibacter aerophilus TaxID=670293 RepID=A0A512BJ11_9BACT|nr:hypothetical protein [Segetibacter aerophilus]GEO11962.1 hypothetical protein SAE01_44580 [Segetibacter aerophilus]